MAQAYKVDFTTRTITITAEFEKAMSNPEAAEYKIIKQLCADFPGMRIVKRTHRTPTHYTSKNGEKSACNPYKNLTYEKMERFMDQRIQQRARMVHCAVPPLPQKSPVLSH